jgi:hypothetical protein
MNSNVKTITLLTPLLALGSIAEASGSATMSVSVYGNQQHFAYLDASGNVEDAFFDGSSWHLQKINNGGNTWGCSPCVGARQ